uniref:Uncharacterized protein n=1 Tax=Cannabis sativa TaxID=3483 RepID=A0A803QIM7_CANSA
MDEQVPRLASGQLRVNTNAAIDTVSKGHSFRVVASDDFDNIKADFVVPIVGVALPEVAEAKAILVVIS